MLGPASIVYEISSRLPDETLESLSHTPLWSAIADAAQYQTWWHARCEWLVGHTLTWRQGEDWANMYTSLLKVKDDPRFDVSLDYSNPLLVSVLLELGVDPTLPIRVADRPSWNDEAPIPTFISPIELVVRDGNIVAVAHMLADPRVDDIDLDRGSQKAIKGNRKDILDLLTSDPRMTDGTRIWAIKGYEYSQRTPWS